MILWVVRGVGTHIYPLGLTGLSDFFVNLFAIEILYTVSICLTKYSILLFYWRIFNKSNMRYALYIVACLVTGWGLGVVSHHIIQYPSDSILWHFDYTYSPFTNFVFILITDFDNYFPMYSCTWILGQNH